jgi:hypothetical protein
MLRDRINVTSPVAYPVAGANQVDINSNELSIIFAYPWERFKKPSNGK